MIITNQIDFILQKFHLQKDNLICSGCGEKISDINHLAAIFPLPIKTDTDGGSRAVVVCDNFKCLILARDKLVKEI